MVWWDENVFSANQYTHRNGSHIVSIRLLLFIHSFHIILASTFAQALNPWAPHRAIFPPVSLPVLFLTASSRSQTDRWLAEKRSFQLYSNSDLKCHLCSGFSFSLLILGQLPPLYLRLWSVTTLTLCHLHQCWVALPDWSFPDGLKALRSNHTHVFILLCCLVPPSPPPYSEFCHSLFASGCWWACAAVLGAMR